MKTIYYFTTSQDIESFKKFLSCCRVAPNLSNQNFHNKLIRSLSLTNHIEVISVRPFNKNCTVKSLKENTIKDPNINWNYIACKQSKIDKFLFTKRRMHKYLKNINSNSVIFVDTLNLTLLSAALYYGHKYKVDVIGICTDNPNNISYVRNSYKKSLITKSNKLDGYIALTTYINDLLNTKNKKHIVIEGITEETKIEPMHSNVPYIFFGGSLMFKYGVGHLIRAFKSIENPDLRLFVAGHHENDEFLQSITDDKRIIYLGALNYDEISAYEKGSLCCINPRPIDPQIDNYSIPSKTLEYFSNGALTISVKNVFLENNYNNCAIWLENISDESIKQAILEALNLNQETLQSLRENAKKEVFKQTSLQAINAKIDALFF